MQALHHAIIQQCNQLNKQHKNSMQAK